ncbi:MAG TPA: GIY-YIG nuclease family protein [Frateuria sp.]|uniref:GIY-YIG nuclease family protein n=1 Tax=Frateuria sp. TaxID=2211372 RepID=UPI002DE92B78|nr:GIY-YIG nuclease family protein [Frateuria sp.]
MSFTRDHILAEIKRTAAANGGKPLGRLAFLGETGIRESDWRGRFWARWNEVLKDAGFGPNKLNEGREDSVLLDRFAGLAIELGRLPVYSEIRLRKRTDPTFPNDKTYARFGTKAQLLSKLYEHCSSDPLYATLLPLIEAELNVEDSTLGQPPPATEAVEGFVYLVKMGKHFKIGKTFSVPRRHREIELQLPEKLKPVHVIRTDDPSGIEVYWHNRFKAKCTNGEWFSLSAEDVRVFKKRKFM